jgi:hypothetical protein
MSTRYTQPLGAARISNATLQRAQPAMTRKSLLQTLIEIVGCKCAEKMIGELGGARIWVPVRSTSEAKLTQVLGESAASALCAHFGGDYLQVPNTMTDDDIYLRIAELHRQGCKINDIALAVGRSRRTVFRLLRKKITDLRRPGRLTKDTNSFR